jgi:hypothetical protein
LDFKRPSRVAITSNDIGVSIHVAVVVKLGVRWTD